MTHRPVSLLIGASLVCLVLFSVFAWPTMYRYETVKRGLHEPAGVIDARIKLEGQHAGPWLYISQD